MVCCIGAAVFDWWLCLAITPHHDVAITTSLMVLRPLSVALCGVELRSLNLSGERHKVCIDDVGGRQLLAVVLEGESVLTFFRHFHQHGCLAHPTTVGSVGFQKILPCVAVQASLAEVLALLVLALVIEEAIEVLSRSAANLCGAFYPAGC